MATQGLTPKQQQILTFIEEYCQKHCLSPTLREVQAAVGLQSVSTVAQHVKALRAQGLLPAEGGRRNLIPCPFKEAKPAERCEIPFLGFFSPTTGIETLAVPRTVEVAAALLPETGSFYAIQVRGGDLVEEGIFDGDTLIIAVGSAHRPGQAALIRDGREWWLRRPEPAGDYLCLESLTERSAPVFRPVEQVEILGIVLGLQRTFER
jgi:repressor LexA